MYYLYSKSILIVINSAKAVNQKVIFMIIIVLHVLKDISLMSKANFKIV